MSFTVIAARRRVDITLGAAMFALFLTTAFRNGWTRTTTDFPNYYTAAVAARRGLPLKDYYGWTWFQREMNYTGTERQLGAYIPQTPLALVPFLPLAGLSPETARRAWLILNAIFLLLTIALLAGAAGVGYRSLLLIIFAAFGALYSNFLLGQYYVFLACLLALSIWMSLRGRQAAAGALMGVIFALKLYTGPFILFFIAKRYWKAAAAMLITIAGLAVCSIALFGLDANLYYVRSVLPAALTGMLIDPYNPGQGSFVAFLRRTLVTEPDLNPHPWLQAPSLFVFLSSLFTLGILSATLSVLWQSSGLARRQLAWLVIALLLLSPVNATYVFTLLIVPVALLFPAASVLVRFFLLAGLAVAGAPFPPSIQPWFPRVWILVALFLYAGWPGLRALSHRAVATAGTIVVAASLARAWRAPPQPAPGFERLILPAHTLAAMSPALTSQGLIYQTFGKDRYVLHAQSKEYEFAGHAFHPAASPLGGPLVFELVANGHSRLLSLDLSNRSTQQIAGPEFDPREPCVSADGRVAFVSRGSLFIYRNGRVTGLGLQGDDPSFYPSGSSLVFSRSGRIFSVDFASNTVVPVTRAAGAQTRPAISPDGRALAYVEAGISNSALWLQRLPSGEAIQLTSQSCNSDSPVWQSDSRRLIFTSDCGRGFGLPALYSMSAGAEPVGQ